MQLSAVLKKWETVAHRYDPEWTAEAGLEDLQRSADELQWVDDGYALLLPLDTGSYLVDLVGASRALQSGHVRATGGDDANRLTRLFERQVQSVIDQTDWRPEGQFRALIGKQIRIAGQGLTDIDAVGCRNGQLILVDAKAWATPATLEFGEFFAVEDRRRVAATACDEWQRKVQVLRENPQLLALPDDIEVIGIVVCPEAPFVLPGPCTSVVGEGLFALSSLAELDWCLRTPDQREASSRPGNSMTRELLKELVPTLMTRRRIGGRRT